MGSPTLNDSLTSKVGGTENTRGIVVVVVPYRTVVQLYGSYLLTRSTDWTVLYSTVHVIV